MVTLVAGRWSLVAGSTIAEVRNAAANRLRAAGIEDARIEADVLLMHALGIDRAHLYARLQNNLDDFPAAEYSALVARRLAHEPAAYITGNKEFYGLDLRCTPDALVPRPETELLVELALARLRREEQGTKNKEQGRPSRPLVVDVGTGTGAIAIAIAAQASNARLIAIDPSRAALATARENAGRHGVADRISFVQGALLETLRARADVIVANLPYISTGEYQSLAPEVREHEPELALHAGPRGTELIESLIAGAPALLSPGGLLVAEHAWDQGETLGAVARRSFRDARIETKRDLAGLERALVIEVQ
ncbi:MAG: peptide chain release factor N(5)-glutamine methyltransferase [Dehalococcoidia bacterium]